MTDGMKESQRPRPGTCRTVSIVYNCYHTGRRESGKVFDKLCLVISWGGAARVARTDLRGEGNPENAAKWVFYCVFFIKQQVIK